MPVIAISPSGSDEKRFLLTKEYMEAVLRAGGAPVMTPLCDSEAVAREILEKADALVLSGGADVDPGMYREEKMPCCGDTAPLRDLFETMLLRTALSLHKPVLGVCRGLEVANCVLGGALYQDIAQQLPGAIKHPCYDVPRDCVHTVDIRRGSLLHRVTGLDAVPVNSRHHQGVKRLGHGLIASAYAPDGLVEAYEMEDGYPLLCVQWHPESLCDRMPPHLKIWSWLINEASR